MVTEKQEKLDLILEYAEYLNMQKVCDDHLIRYQTYKNIKRGNFVSIEMLDRILRAQSGEAGSLIFELSQLNKQCDKLLEK